MKVMIATFTFGGAYLITIAFGTAQSILAVACFICVICMLVQIAEEHRDA